MARLRDFEQKYIQFRNLLKLFLALVLINAVLRLSGVFVPFALLFGPLQFFTHQLSKGKSVTAAWLYHLIPFVAVSLLFGALGAPLYLAVLTLSYGGYSAYIWMDRGASFNPGERLIVLQIAAVSAVGSLFVATLFFVTIGFFEPADIGFNPSYVLYGLLLICSTMLFAYLLGNRRAVFEEDPGSAAEPRKERRRRHAHQFDESVLQAYASHMESVIDEKKLFLNAALSMDDLQQETGIPKHHLSRVFTVCFGKTFYQYIAEKRIEEAKLRMRRNANITIEFLAFECGFNSKTTFNKYFKQISSVTPSEYRSSLSEN
jgi:AraC-like DNA-binding protein